MKVTVEKMLSAFKQTINSFRKEFVIRANE